MDLPVMAPALGAVIVTAASLDACWRKVTLTTPGAVWGPTVSGGSCGKPPVNDVGLCSEHLEELRSWDDAQV